MQRLAALPEALQEALLAKTGNLNQLLMDKVQGKLSGDVLDSKSGLLSNSITSDVTQDGAVISGGISVSDDVPYAAIQEYGGITKAHIIQIQRAKALAFSWQGKAAFYTIIHHPGSVIPAHNYMSSSLADVQDDILTGMQEALEEAVD